MGSAKGKARTKRSGHAAPAPTSDRAQAIAPALAREPQPGQAAVAAPGPQPPDVAGHPRNEVLLVGRVAAPAEVRTLPSGDLLVSWRLVVDRPPGAPRSPAGTRAVSIDTLDCTGWVEPVRRAAEELTTGDVVEVRGALRRRFWRGPQGVASRCEVEVQSLRPVD